MTNLQMKMMLHYYAIAEPYAQRDHRHANSSAVYEQRRDLIMNGLLEADECCPSMYKVTEKGEAYVKALGEVKIPVCKWVQPE